MRSPTGYSSRSPPGPRTCVPAERVHFVGNVMIDTLQANLARAREGDTLERLGLEAGGYVALTLHRPSNVDDPSHLQKLFEVFAEIDRELPVVFPIHPRTRSVFEQQLGGKVEGLRMIDHFLRLMADARFVLTDSGGVQEETTVLRVPCLTMRENTERPVTVTEGTNQIVGRDPEAIRAAARALLDGDSKAGQIPELWDGKASARIVDVLERDLS